MANRKNRTVQIISLLIYYTLLRYLPNSSTPFIGRLCRRLRYLCCRNIFAYCGRNVNIERLAFFGSGINLSIGDESGLGVKCCVPNDIIIGRNVMMGPNCYILNKNHNFLSIDIPMIQQGYTESKGTVIEDDVWIGRNVTFTPGRTVHKGTIIGACCLLTKEFPEYSIIGGNPSRLIRSRI